MMWVNWLEVLVDAIHIMFTLLRAAVCARPSYVCVII